MTAATLTIAREGVRIFLQGANEAAEHGDVLRRMFMRRKDSRETEAIQAGYLALLQDERRCVEALRDRGGLLHFGVARVDYANGAYLVVGTDLPGRR